MPLGQKKKTHQAVPQAWRYYTSLDPEPLRYVDTRPAGNVAGGRPLQTTVGLITRLDAKALGRRPHPAVTFASGTLDPEPLRYVGACQSVNVDWIWSEFCTLHRLSTHATGRDASPDILQGATPNLCGRAGGRDRCPWVRRKKRDALD